MNWIWRTNRTPKRPQNKWERRASRLSQTELLDWSETSLNGIGRSLADFRRTGNPVFLLEAQEGSQALLAVTSVLSPSAGPMNNAATR